MFAQHEESRPKGWSNFRRMRRVIVSYSQPIRFVSAKNQRGGHWIQGTGYFGSAAYIRWARRNLVLLLPLLKCTATKFFEFIVFAFSESLSGTYSPVQQAREDEFFYGFSRKFFVRHY